MKEIVLEINGKEHKVKIKEHGAETAKIEVNGNLYDVVLKDLGIPKPVDVKPVPPPVKREAVKPNETSQLRKPKNVVSSGNITAPLPGLIIDVMVKPGDAVKTGQDVLIMEAMKMENEVQAAQDGVVKEVKVKRGDSVYEGDVLIVLE